MTDAGDRWQGMTVGSHRRLALYLRWLADRVELRDWTLDLSFEALPDDADALAQVEIVYGRKRAKVTLCREFSHLDPEVQRHVLLHELVHCHFDEAHRAPERTLDTLVGKPAAVVLLDQIRTALEHGVDAIASALEDDFATMPRWWSKYGRHEIPRNDPAHAG